MKTLASAIAALVLCTGAAVAQTPTGLAAGVSSVPFVSTLNQSTDAVPITPRGQPTSPKFATPGQLTTVYGYIKQAQTETSGALTVTMGAAQSYLLLTGTQLTSGTVTINFPSPASDGQKFCLRSVLGVTSGATIAYGPSTATFTTTPTAFTAATTYCYLYSLSNTTWDPI